MKIDDRKQSGRELGLFKGLVRFGFAALFLMSATLQAGEPVDKIKAQNMRELEVKMGMTSRIVRALGVPDLFEDNAIAGLQKGLEGLMKADPDLVYAIAMAYDGKAWVYVDLEGNSEKRYQKRLTDEMTEWAMTLSETSTKKTSHKGISVIELAIPIEGMAPLGYVDTQDTDAKTVINYIRLGFRVP